MARKKKTELPIVSEVQEQVVEQPKVEVKKQVASPTEYFKCLECGLLNDKPRCARCGSSMIRIIR